MTIEVDTVTLPAYWACALVNGDVDGMEPEEQEALEVELKRLARDGWRVVDVARDETGEAEEARFTWQYHLYDRTAFDRGIRGGEVLDYIMHRVTAEA